MNCLLILHNIKKVTNLNSWILLTKIVVYRIDSKQHNNEMESAITMLIQYQLSAKCCVAVTARIINEIASASLISPYRHECNFLLLIKDSAATCERCTIQENLVMEGNQLYIVFSEKNYCY
jgi:hypothetical protein